MIDLVRIVSASISLIQWLKSLLHENQANRKRWKKAIGFLQTAVVETQIYVANIERGNAVNQAKEQELAHLWRKASNAFLNLDGQLAERLQLKGEYWTQPEVWTKKQVRSANISLQHVAEYTRQLLRQGK